MTLPVPPEELVQRVAYIDDPDLEGVYLANGRVTRERRSNPNSVVRALEQTKLESQDEVCILLNRKQVPAAIRWTGNELDWSGTGFTLYMTVPNAGAGK